LINNQISIISDNGSQKNQPNTKKTSKDSD